jgi:hypothetical protein
MARSALRFGKSGLCIVTVEQQFHFAFLDKWIYFYIYFSLLKKYFYRYCLGEGTVAITAVAYSSLTPEERRHTWQIGVSVGIPVRRVPGPIFAH